MRTKKIVYAFLIVFLAASTACNLTGVLPAEPQPATEPSPDISSFEECAQAGYPVMESYPRKCQTPDGQIFVEDVEVNAQEQPPAPAIAPADISDSPFAMSIDNHNLFFSFDSVHDIGAQWLRLPAPYIDNGVNIVKSILDERIINERFNGYLMLSTISYPEDIEDYKNFVKNIVTNYGPGTKYNIQYFQVNNEPNLEVFWQGSMEEYAELLRITYTTIKETSPEAKVLLGSVAMMKIDFFEELFAYSYEDNSGVENY